MKKSYLLVLFLLVIPVLAFGAEFRAGEQPTVESNEKIFGSAYIAGGTVTSMGSVAEDLVIGGGNIFVSGDVGADVLAGGGSITITSDVSDDVRLAGGNIVISGKVLGDVVVAGGQVTLGGSGIGGDVLIGGGNIRIDAPVSGSLRIVGGNIYLNAPVDGDINITADKVTLGKSAVIKGKLTYKASEELTKEEGAIILGEVDFKQRSSSRVSTGVLLSILSLWVIGKFLALFVSALIVGLYFKRYSGEVMTRAIQNPMFEIGKGLLILILLPALSLVLIMTIIGAPLGFISIIAFVLLLLFGWIISPIIVGSVVYQYFKKDDYEVSMKTIFIGVLVYKVFGAVPVVGFIFKLLMMLLSVGVIGSIKHQIVKEWR